MIRKCMYIQIKNLLNFYLQIEKYVHKTYVVKLITFPGVLIYNYKLCNGQSIVSLYKQFLIKLINLSMLTTWTENRLLLDRYIGNFLSIELINEYLNDSCRNRYKGLELLKVSS